MIRPNIIEVASIYTELIPVAGKYKAKTNPLRDEKTSSFFIYPSTQRFYDFGSGAGGDVLDFIAQVENISLSDAFKKYQNGEPIKRGSTPTPQPKDNNSLKAKLNADASVYLKNNKPYRFFEFQDQTTKDILFVTDEYSRLFEGNYHEVREDIAVYVFNEFLGYCNHFKSPVIILRDLGGDVVNIVKYRPKTKEGKEFTKYLYLKNEDRPQSDYLYPFQAENEKLMDRFNFSFVGEGLKNALVAMLYQIPFVSIESSSNISKRLLDYLKDKSERFSFIGFFDGDEAGKRAFEKVREVIPIENQVSFVSGIDFAVYVQEVANGSN